MMPHKRDPFLFCLVVLVPFLVGLIPRIGLLSHPHNEGDEVIYMALIEQLESGAGYTLKGHPILTKLRRSKKTYDTQLFFHPPVGPYSFWLAYKILGERGPLLAQLFYYALYFISMMLLFRYVVQITDPRVLALGGFLVALTPIPAHVNMKLWIDNPKLAFSAIGTFLYLRSLQVRSVWLAGFSGALVGAAILTKLDTLIFVPGLLVFALIASSGDTLRKRWQAYRPMLQAFLAASIFMVGSWLCFSRVVSGHWITFGAGTLADPENRFLSLVFSFPSDFYLTRLLEISTSLAPAVVICLVGVFGVDRPALSREVVLALLGWLLFIVLSYIVLAHLDIAQLLRYEILVIIPGLMIVMLAIQTALDSQMRASIEQNIDKRLWRALLGLLVIGYLTESFVGLLQMAVWHQNAVIVGIF